VSRGGLFREAAAQVEARRRGAGRRGGMRALRTALLVLLATGAAGALLVGIAALRAQPAAPHPFFAGADARPWVIAHRGGALLWPENTLHAFLGAAALGADVLEADVHATADGTLVLLHDFTVDRTTDGTGAIASLTAAEARRLDAGYRWSPDGGETHPLRGAGLTLPTVDELLTTFPAVRLNLELKPDDTAAAERLCAAVRAHGAADRVLLASFHHGVVRAFRRACPEVATTASTRETQVLFAVARLRLARAYTPPAQAVQAPERRGRVHVLTPGFVRAAQRRGMHVHAWTVNDSTAMRRLLDAGVDGIITDRPDLLLRIRAGN
jgi:glycerophosphoryl diester phosphodiesterase